MFSASILWQVATSPTPRASASSRAASVIIQRARARHLLAKIKLWRRGVDVYRNAIRARICRT